MNLNEINSRIAVINAESKRLNNERQINIGKREALEKQLNEAFALYEKNYGVKLTIETLEQEVNRVVSDKNTEISRIEQMLNLIKSGNYDEANKLAGVDTAQHMQREVMQSAMDAMATPVAETPVAPTIPVAETPVVPTAPVTETPVAPTSPSPIPVVGTPTPPVLDGQTGAFNVPTASTPPVPPTPVAEPPVTKPTVTETPAVPTIPNLDMSSGFVAPPPMTGIDSLETSNNSIPAPPKPPTPVTRPDITNFGAILGGQPYNP